MELKEINYFEFLNNRKKYNLILGEDLLYNAKNSYEIYLSSNFCLGILSNKIPSIIQKNGFVIIYSNNQYIVYSTLKNSIVLNEKVDISINSVEFINDVTLIIAELDVIILKNNYKLKKVINFSDIIVDYKIEKHTLYCVLDNGSTYKIDIKK